MKSYVTAGSLVLLFGFSYAYAGNITIRLAPPEVTAKRGETPKIKLTVENRTNDKVRLVLPRDGNDSGPRRPVIGWSLKPVESTGDSDKMALPIPAISPFGYQILTPIRRSDFFTISPSEGTELSDFFPLSNHLSPGRYRAVFYYIFDPRKKASGFVIGKNEPGVDQLLSKATPCRLVSNEIIVTITD